MEKERKINGFGILGIIILVAVIASAAFGGGMYWNETKKQQSFLQVGADAKKRAEELKQAIESREESIFGSPTSEDTDVDTSTWKTYRNEKYGFEVKYPADWAASETQDVVVFISPELKKILDDPKSVDVPATDVTITVVQNPERLKIQDFVNHYDEGWFMNYRFFKDMTVDGKMALRISDADSKVAHAPIDAAFVDSKNYILLFTRELQKTDQSAIFNNLLLTLNFNR